MALKFSLGTLDTVPIEVVSQPDYLAIDFLSNFPAG
jgi:hypothetical protein